MLEYYLGGKKHPISEEKTGINMKLQTPKYSSLRDYIKSADKNKELFDIKEQFDEELWCTYLGSLCDNERASRKSNKEFYQNRIDQLKSLNGESALINYLDYKGLPKFCDFDCDGTVRKNYLKQGFYSWFPREIYRCLWNWQDLCRVNDVEFKYATIRQFGQSCYEPDMQMGPDTMNSFWITFSTYLITNHSDTYRWNNFKNTVFFKDGENGKQRDRADRIKKLIESDANYICSDKIKMFAELTHTVGNLVLVPAGYNGYRGTQPCIKDYFDLSLDNLLHDWDANHYLGDGSKAGKQSYIKYINTFFLWDYVDDNYEALPLCESHKNQMMGQKKSGRLEAKGVLPKKEEIDVLCVNINDKIRRRSLFMIAMLRIAMGIGLDGQDVDLGYTYDGKYRDEWENWKASGIYKKIMEEVFLTDRIYTDGYDEVVKAIKKKTAGNKDEEFIDGVLGSVFQY